VQAVAATLTRVASALATSTATINIPAESEFQLSGAPSKVLADVMKPVFDALAVPDGTSPTWVGGLIGVWRELTESGLEGMGDEYKMIAKALRAPIDAFDLDPASIPQSALDAYIFGVIPGLLVLAREARDQREEADG